MSSKKDLVSASKGTATTTRAKSTQLALFELLGPSETEYSNTIELYDALPKGMVPARRKRKKSDEPDAATGTDKGLDPLIPSVITTPFKSRGTNYQLKVKPAIIERKQDDGSTTSVILYPGTREELVEEALRKFAAQGQGFESDNNKDVGVFFTVSQLRKELARTGHTYSAQEILEALDIMSSSLIEVSQAGKSRGNDAVRGNMLTSLILTTRDSYLENSTTKCYATFHPLVTRGIRTQHFRMYDYSISMTLKSDLARYMYKRMSHYWVQASPDHPYELKLTTFLANSPRGVSEKMKDNLRAMRTALACLVEKDVIIPDWEEVMIKNPSDKRVLDEVEFRLWPSNTFVKFMMKANRRQGDIRGQAALGEARQTLKGSPKEAGHESDDGNIFIDS